MDVLEMAWQKVAKNGGAAGIDGQTIQAIKKDIGVDVFLLDIQQQLLEKTYSPLPVLRVYIGKADGKKNDRSEFPG